MNQFTERYKTFSSSDLLRVIENPFDYQAEAVEAAQSEINLRNLSDPEMAIAKINFEAEQKERQRQIEKNKEVEEKIQTIKTSIFNTINPIQESAPTAERLIRSVSLVFGLIAVFKLYELFGFLKFMFTETHAEWDLSMVGYFISVIILPIAILLFWLRKKMGWVLMTIYLTNSAFSALVLVIILWNTEPLGIPALDILYPQTSSTTQIMVALFFGGVLWVLNKKMVMDHFCIKRQMAVLTIVFTIILTSLYLVPFLW